MFGYVWLCLVMFDLRKRRRSVKGKSPFSFVIKQVVCLESLSLGEDKEKFGLEAGKG